jgi:predicted Zn-dependent protease
LSPFIARPLIDPEVFDLAHITPGELDRLGRELHELIVSRHRAVDTADRRRVNEVARSLQPKGAPRTPAYVFTIIDSDDIFAFSHPDRYIYLSSALFALVSSDDELRFVLAHEMAHLALGHALKRIEAEGPTPGIGTLQQFYHGIAGGYSDEQEFEADAWAARRLVQLEHTRRECLAFLRRFQGYSEEHGFGEGHRRPQTDLAAPLQEVENHFAAHPPVWERLERLQELLEQPPVNPPAPARSPK